MRPEAGFPDWRFSLPGVKSRRGTKTLAGFAGFIPNFALQLLASFPVYTPTT
jgi:hypothetical protein